MASLVFYGERYPVIRKGQGKNMDITEIAKLVGKEWRELDEKDKQKFKQRVEGVKLDLSGYPKSASFFPWGGMAQSQSKQNGALHSSQPSPVL
jgi:hypothetical protein